MAKPFDFGDVNLTAGSESSDARPAEETPFCIAILGDFSGRANRRISDPGSIGTRRAVLIDRDNFDDVLAGFRPALDLPIQNGASLHLRFSELDDFHPDRIFENLDAFEKLRSLRARVQNSSTFPEAAQELGLRGTASEKTEPPTTPPAAPPRASQLAGGSLLDEMIEATESQPAPDTHRRQPDAVRDFARRVAEQHLVSTADPRQPEVLAVMDRAIGSLMSAVLHSSDFQALEAAWRAVFLLVRRLETGSRLKLYMIDVSKEELAKDLAASDEVRGSGLYRLLVEKSVETPGAEPWALIAGNFTFGPSGDDAALLFKIAQIGQRAGAPFVAHASAAVLGCSSLASSPSPRDWKLPPDQSGNWGNLRRSAVANGVGLAAPRFLLRLPYGASTSEVDAFAFEEFSGAPVHEDYLWGNPAFAVALMLGQRFSERGWEMSLSGSTSELDGLPLHIYQASGGSETKPSAEVLLTDLAVEGMLDRGLMPLVSYKNSDRVRLARFQSISDPARGLAGRWAG